MTASDFSCTRARACGRAQRGCILADRNEGVHRRRSSSKCAPSASVCPLTHTRASVSYRRFTTCCAWARGAQVSQESARAIRTDGISPLGTLGQLRDRQRTSRAAGARPELAPFLVIALPSPPNPGGIGETARSADRIDTNAACIAEPRTAGYRTAGEDQ